MLTSLVNSSIISTWSVHYVYEQYLLQVQRHLSTGYASVCCTTVNMSPMQWGLAVVGSDPVSRTLFCLCMWHLFTGLAVVRIKFLVVTIPRLIPVYCIHQQDGNNSLQYIPQFSSLHLSTISLQFQWVQEFTTTATFSSLRCETRSQTPFKQLVMWQEENKIIMLLFSDPPSFRLKPIELHWLPPSDVCGRW